jgi:hypothetical protein
MEDLLIGWNQIAGCGERLTASWVASKARMSAAGDL